MNELEIKVIKEGKEIHLQGGKLYFICTCGTSKELPFCDSSHKKVNEERGTSYKPLRIFCGQDAILYVDSKNYKK